MGGGSVISNLSKTFRYVNELGGQIVFEYDRGYLINKPQGVDTVSISLSQSQGIDQVGATIQSRNVQSKPVVVSGIIVGTDQPYRKEQLVSVVRPDLKGRFYADDFYLDVSVTATPSIGPQPDFASFTFSLLAPYPYWQRDEKANAELSSLEYKFRLPCNFSKPYKFAQLVEQQLFNIVNRGQLPVPFRVTLAAKGDVVNPKITSATTGEFLLLKKRLVQGERVVIDITHDRTYVTSSVDGDVRGALSLQSRLIRLQVGDNVLKPEAESGKPNLIISIEYATEKVGITL